MTSPSRLARAAHLQMMEWLDGMFRRRPGIYTVKYNSLTGPYKLAMRLADGRGMRKRLRQGTEVSPRLTFLGLLRPGWVCCDVGAHVGDYTVEMALVVGDRGKVIAYEAVPYYFNLLQQSIEANRLRNVSARLAAVGAAPGALRIPTNLLVGSLARPGLVRPPGKRHDGTGFSSVPLVRLDDEIERLDAVKIDCEGYEFHVLRGMSRLIGVNRELRMLVEVHPSQLQDVHSSVLDLGRLLIQEYALRVYQVSPRHCLCVGADLDLPAITRPQSPGEFVSAFRGV